MIIWDHKHGTVFQYSVLISSVLRLGDILHLAPSQEQCHFTLLTLDKQREEVEEVKGSIHQHYSWQALYI